VAKIINWSEIPLLWRVGNTGTRRQKFMLKNEMGKQSFTEELHHFFSFSLSEAYVQRKNPFIDNYI